LTASGCSGSIGGVSSLALAVLAGAFVFAVGYVAGWWHARTAYDRLRAFEALEGIPHWERHARELDRAALAFGKDHLYSAMTEAYRQAESVRERGAGQK
jgi:site-specific recombinase